MSDQSVAETTHNIHNRQTSMPPVGFEPTISAGERPKTYALDRVATGTGMKILWYEDVMAYQYDKNVVWYEYLIA